MKLNKSTISRIKEGKAVALVWDVDDIICRFSDMNDDAVLSENIALQVLTAMEQRHDCNYGVTWETIDILTDLALKGEL